MSEFYGIEPGTIPEFAEVGGGKFMSVQSLPEHTVRHMLMFMDKLRGMYQADPLAFEVCVRHVATMIEDQRRGGAPTRGGIRPRDARAPAVPPRWDNALTGSGGEAGGCAGRVGGHRRRQ